MVMTKLVRFWPLTLAFVLAAGLLISWVNPLGPIVLVLVPGLILLIRGIAPRIERLTRRQLLIGLGIGLLAMLLAQIFIVRQLPITVYHDPYRVMAQAEQMAAGKRDWTITYFWRYPNNVPLAFLMSLWLRLTNVFAISTNTSVHLLSLLLLDGFILLALRTADEFSHRNTLVVGLFAFFALSPFAYSYYLQVFYTDLPLMLVLLIQMRQFARWPNLAQAHRVISGLMLVLASLIGMLMKPNLIVLIPAMAIVAVILGRRHLLKQLQLWVPMLLVVLGLGLSVPVTQGIRTVTAYKPHAEHAFPVTHWMMMGLDANTGGTYSEADAKMELTLPDSDARIAYNLEEMQNRVRNMGPVGLAIHWLRKLGSLLNVDSIQRWYSGGFRDAPGWYLDNVGVIRFMIAVSYLAAFGLLIGWSIMRLVFWRPDLTDAKQVAGLLAVVCGLGFLAFHVLLWETGGRYGQVVIPLLMVVLATTKPLPQTAFVRNKRPRGALLAASALMVGVLTVAKAPAVTVVTAQRSQLSKQYQAGPSIMKPGVQLTQQFTARRSFNTISLQAWKNSPIHVVLVNVQTQERADLVKKGNHYVLNQQLPAGRYELRAANETNTDQRIDVVRTNRYRLAQEPLIIDGVAEPYASLIFMAGINANHAEVLKP